MSRKFVEKYDRKDIVTDFEGILEELKNHGSQFSSNHVIISGVSEQ